MPFASAGETKYWLQDHEPAIISQVPPVQNTWYEVFHDYDVRLLCQMVIQLNDESAAKTIQVRWTIDGNVYVGALSCDSGTLYYIYMDNWSYFDDEQGLTITATEVNAALYTDKRGLDFKVEVRITDVAGTNQTLASQCNYETLEVT